MFKAFGVGVATVVLILVSTVLVMLLAGSGLPEFDISNFVCAALVGGTLSAVFTKSAGEPG